MGSALQDLVDRVQTARAAKAPLEIRGGGTKLFYGGVPRGETLKTGALTGISSYEPTELVVTVRAGTPLTELEATLAEQRQALAFEPPRFGDGVDSKSGGTVGGMVAAGLSGPSRAAAGSLRDHLLGVKLLSGKAELLSFGGTVMKNVAGYDVSRLMAGSMGTLGLLCEVSLKVLPLPQATVTVRMELTMGDAIERLNELGGLPLPLSASAWWDGMLVLRFAGAKAAVQAAQARVGGEVVEPVRARTFWDGLRDHRDEFFAGAATAVDHGANLWRLSVPSTTPPLALSGEQLIEWGGAQRWLCTSAPAAVLRDAAASAGGHAVLFRGLDKRAGAFAPLTAATARIHAELKRSFDPDGIFNPGRLVPVL
ncbi:MAG: glycolate oxidase subunit GlcE [Rubrivivax sp.]